MRGLGGIIYGSEGIGKTGFALQFPKPLKCISVLESGFQDLHEIGEVPEGCSNVILNENDTLEEYLTELQDENYKTIVTDSFSGVGPLMREYIKRHYYDDSTNAEKDFASWGEQGWRTHGASVMQKVEVACETLRSKGINVILLGHDKNETVKLPTGEDYKGVLLDLPHDTVRSVILKWAQFCLYMTIDFETRATKLFKGKISEAKASATLESDIARIMYTTKHPSHSAKNRLKLPTFIMMGESAEEAYTNFVKKLPKNFQEHLNEGAN